MLFIQLSVEEEKRLTGLERNSTKHRVRERAKALLLSHQGYSRLELAKYFSKRLDTISDWIHRFETNRSWNLEDAEGRGRKSKLSDEQKKDV